MSIDDISQIYIVIIYIYVVLIDKLIRLAIIKPAAITR